MKKKAIKKRYAVVLEENNWNYMKGLKARTGYSISETINSWITAKREQENKVPFNE